MSETAYKVVTSELKSPYVLWPPAVITYEVGGDYEGEGLWVAGVSDEPGVPIAITDTRNRFRGIGAFPRLDCWWLWPYDGRGHQTPPSSPPGDDPRPHEVPWRYLQLEYELDDLLGVCTSTAPGQWTPMSTFPESLSLAAVHVVDEVTP